MDPKSAEELCFFIVAIVSVALNVTEITAIMRKSRTLKPFDKLLLSLSIADLIISTAVVIFTSLVLSKVVDQPTSSAYFHLVLVFSMSFSLFNIIAITVDRFLAVCFPLRHKIHMSSKVFNAVVASVWLIGIVLASTLTILAVYVRNYHKYTMIVLGVFVLSLGVAFACIYAYMLRHMLHTRYKVRQNSNMECAPPCSMTEVIFDMRCKLERNVLFTACLVVFSFVFSTYPFAIEMLVRENKLAVSYGTQMCLLMNSVLDPLVYFFKGYRERGM